MESMESMDVDSLHDAPVHPVGCGARSTCSRRQVPPGAPSPSALPTVLVASVDSWSLRVTTVASLKGAVRNGRAPIGLRLATACSGAVALAVSAP